MCLCVPLRMFVCVFVNKCAGGSILIGICVGMYVGACVRVCVGV